MIQGGPFLKDNLVRVEIIAADSILIWIALLCISFTKYPTPIFSVHSPMLLLSFKHLICIVLCLSAFGWLCVCVCLPDGAKRRQSLSWQHVADTAAVAACIAAAAARQTLSTPLHLCPTHHPPASPWFPCFSNLPPFAYHPFISISALLRGANCTKFAQVPPKCTMKMNNYVYEFSSLLLLIIPSCRLVCLIKCLRGSDKNIFLITEYTNLQLWATK